MDDLLKTFLAVGILAALTGDSIAQDALPFDYTVETFQHEEDDVRVFVVRLEQPFLAEEFEKSNYLRLRATDDRAFLIYPRETRFEQKHAEFYGRLRGEGTAVVRLSYETVSENPDGSRRINNQSADIEIPIPSEPAGVEGIYKTWARHQNQHFADLLEYYPGESFFEYLLLQSRERYGVDPPDLTRLRPEDEVSEEGLYRTLTGGLELQQSLQRSVLRGSAAQGDLVTHVSMVPAPRIDSLDYDDLLKNQLDEKLDPAPHDVARLIPADQYLLHFNAYTGASQLYDSFQNWAEPLFRMLAENAQNHHLRNKYERQLGIRLSDLADIFAEDKATEFAVTGSDFFVAEGTDLSILIRTTDADGLRTTLQKIANDTSGDVPDIVNRDFNYRGVKIHARYTTDRMISAFTVVHDGWLVISNSHVGIRRIVDTIQENIPSLGTVADYQYMTTLLPPSGDERSGYFYCSDALLRYLNSPMFKIGERRRKQSFNNLVMLNNASLFHRLEYGRSPGSLADLIEGRFVTPGKIVCPQGGAYAIDTVNDTATSSVFNRIRYLTPIRELDVQKVSSQEQSEYGRYVQRYEAFWGNYFAPVAVRFSTGDKLKLEYCVLPYANRADWGEWQSLADSDARQIQLRPTAKSAFASVHTLPGREMIGDSLRMLPGVHGVLNDDPTLTDLVWLGDGMSLHFCDAHTVLEVDPTQIKPLRFPIPLGIPEQSGIAAGLFASAAPIYVSLDVEDEDKANRFLQQLSSRIFLHQQNLGEINTAIDAYQLPAYKDHPIYVVSYRIYVARVRLYLTVVGNQLVAATEPNVLREVIDVAGTAPERDPVDAQLAVRLDADAMVKLKDDVRLFWQERSRHASYRNIMPIYTLLQLYGVELDEVDRLSNAKYGVTYFCPDGEYRFDKETGRVYSTAYGDRRNAMQAVMKEGDSTFDGFLKSAAKILFTVRLDDESMTGVLEVMPAGP